MSPDTSLSQNSPLSGKIALFRSLFRGREDLHARRYQSRATGQSGYQPACGNEWIRGICDKPRIRCFDCPNQRFLPVTDEGIRWHLEGCDGLRRPFAIAVYPMLRDETCWFLAAEFDGPGWAEDALAVLRVSREAGFPAALERVRTADAARLWWFFLEAIPAVQARQLGTLFLTEALHVRPELGLQAYDRLIPRQDTLPSVGFGSPIALPFQKEAMAGGNSTFVDEQWRSIADPWRLLSTWPRFTRATVEAAVGSAIRRGPLLPVREVRDEAVEGSGSWHRPVALEFLKTGVPGPILERLEIRLSNQIEIDRDGLPPAWCARLMCLAAFQNPGFRRAQSMRMPVGAHPRVVALAAFDSSCIRLPRGCLDEVADLFARAGVPCRFRDDRVVGHPIEVSFLGELRPSQKAAVSALLTHDTGVLEATTAFGKTVVGAWMIAARRTHTLVLVHRQQLLDQWIERLSGFLGIPPASIGCLGGGRRRLGGKIDVALLQSLLRRGVVDERVANYGQVIVDECHHLSAPSFDAVIRTVPARFVLGLSATLERRDGQHPAVLMQCGPVRYRVDARSEAAERSFLQEVVVRPTGFLPRSDPESDPRQEFQKLIGGLASDIDRNAMILADAVNELAQGRSPLILTERIEHIDLLAESLQTAAPEAARVLLRGGMKRSERESAMRRLRDLPANQPRVVIATGRFVGEGFDDARLDTLLVALPVSWRGTVAQYVGRLHRLHVGKQVVRVYDYADLAVPMLARMFDRRCAGYAAAGYTIHLPASAVPGWPAAVPLPVAPAWKREYADTIRRLVRDGVDEPLARWFVHAASPPEPGAEDADRARSATEAFLYHRLNTLRDTAHRFRLNVRLPIPFNGEGELEVDLLDEDARVAVEIDGPQHLGSPEAYRRDRQKDALLQEHGWLVLRFLATDVGTRLDRVLDSILRAVTRRRRG